MISGIKTGLTEIAKEINLRRTQVVEAKRMLESVVSELGALSETYSVIIAEIGTLGSDASDLLYKDELAKLTTEFVALVASANGAIGEL